ncbi:MAG TPA: DUF192 domain-containing protein [Candidatus Sulfotelmatobacter sp.]|nr:DUF192 domain-containing protein [Candidatus Sulfotelmatobacter sp.]
MIFNSTKKRVIARSFFKKGGFEKIVGQIGKKTPQAIVFKTRFGIHTLFMKYSIDIIVVDKNKKVVLTKRNLKPNRILVWNILYDTVIELPSGSLYESKTTKGDILKFKL